MCEYYSKSAHLSLPLLGHSVIMDIVPVYDNPVPTVVSGMRVAEPTERQTSLCQFAHAGTSSSTCCTSHMQTPTPLTPLYTSLTPFVGYQAPLPPAAITRYNCFTSWFCVCK
jgi:hypothetical protein